MYFYEDGSFKSESSLDEDGKELRFTLIRGAKGALDPSALYVRDSEAYDEWQYETDSGITVNIALDHWNELTGTVPVLVFCDTEDYIITVAGECRNIEDIRESAESFAGRFDYAALSGGETDPAAFDVPAPSEPAQRWPIRPLPLAPRSSYTADTPPPMATSRSPRLLWLLTRQAPSLPQISTSTSSLAPTLRASSLFPTRPACPATSPRA